MNIYKYLETTFCYNKFTEFNDESKVIVKFINALNESTNDIKIVLTKHELYCICKDYITDLIDINTNSFIYIDKEVRKEFANRLRTIINYYHNYDVTFINNIIKFINESDIKSNDKPNIKPCCKPNSNPDTEQDVKPFCKPNSNIDESYDNMSKEDLIKRIEYLSNIM